MARQVLPPPGAPSTPYELGLVKNSNTNKTCNPRCIFAALFGYPAELATLIAKHTAQDPASFTRIRQAAAAAAAWRLSLPLDYDPPGGNENYNKKKGAETALPPSY